MNDEFGDGESERERQAAEERRASEEEALRAGIDPRWDVDTPDYSPEEEERVHAEIARQSALRRRRKAAELAWVAAQMPEPCFAFRVRRLDRMVTGAFERAMSGPMVPERKRLRTTQLAVLGAIARAEGRRTITALADELSLHRSTLSRSLTRLVRRGLVALERARDGRARIPKVTADGRRTLTAAMARWERATARVYLSFGKARHEPPGWFFEDLPKVFDSVSRELATKRLPGHLVGSLREVFRRMPPLEPADESAGANLPFPKIRGY